MNSILIFMIAELIAIIIGVIIGTYIGNKIVITLEKEDTL